MRVVMINGVVRVLERVKPTRLGKVPVYRYEKFRNIIVRGFTHEEIVSNFQYFTVSTNKEVRNELLTSQNEGKIKLIYYSIEKILGIEGLPPGYSLAS